MEVYRKLETKGQVWKYNTCQESKHGKCDKLKDLQLEKPKPKALEILICLQHNL